MSDDALEEDIYRIAARVKYNFGIAKVAGEPITKISTMDPHDDLFAFIKEAMNVFKDNAGFQKELSGYGGIRFSAAMTKNFFQSKRGPSIHIDKQLHNNGSIMYYRGSYDLGNVCYFKYMQSVLSGEEFKHYFGEDPSQERVGDMVEALLAMFDVAQQLPGAFPGWGDIEMLRTGLEESIKRVTASFIDMTTYDNRKRARVRYLDPNSAEASSLNLIVYKIRGTGRPTHTIDYRFEMGLAMAEHVETPPPSEEEQGAIEQDADMEAEPEAIDVETEPDQEMGTEVALSAEQEQLLKMINEVERQFGSISFCIHCSSGGHSTMDCIQQLPPHQR